MAATIDSPPGSPGYNRDNVFVTIQTDLITLTPATVHLDWAGTGPALGETLLIEWAGNSILFTVASTTNQQATAIPVWDGAETLAQLVDRVTEAFRQNDILTADFVVSRGGTVGAYERVSFIQRVPGALDLTVDNDLDLGAINKVIDTVIDGEAPNTESNLAAYLQVWQSDDDPNYDTRIVSLHAPYDTSNSQAVFNLKDLFNLTPGLPDTDSIGAGYPGTWHNGVASAAFVRYYLRYSDKYGIPAVSEALLKSGNYYMLHGGRPGDTLGLVSLSATARLLHAYSRADGGTFRKPVHCMQPDWVYLWALVTLEGCRVDLLITWSESTQTVEEVTSATWILDEKKIHWLASGPLQHNIEDWVPPVAGAKPVYYTWRLYADAGSGEELIVSVDYELLYHPWQFILLMDNGLGGCETVLMGGKTAWKYNAERDTARRHRWTDYSVSGGELFAFSEEGNHTIEASTGWHELYYIEHLRQLLLGDLWIVDTENDRFLRVVCESKSVDIQKHDQQLFSLTVTLRASWFDSNWHL